MAISEKLKIFLQESKAKYTAAKRPVVYTAQEIAAAQHIPGRELAKCVLVKTERGPVLAVLPAIHLIDLKKLKGVLGVKTLSIAKEADIKGQFPDVEVGAMSPFGNLYGVPVIVDRDLGESEEIACNAGSHTDTIKMRYQDFVRLVHPKVGAFGQHVGGPAAGKKKKGAPAKRGTPSQKKAIRSSKKKASRSRARKKRR